MLTVIRPEATMMGESKFRYLFFVKLDNSFKLFVDLDDSNIKLNRLQTMFFENNFKALLGNFLFHESLQNHIKEYSEYLRLKRKFEC